MKIRVAYEQAYIDFVRKNSQSPIEMTLVKMLIDRSRAGKLEGERLADDCTECPGGIVTNVYYGYKNYRMPIGIPKQELQFFEVTEQ